MDETYEKEKQLRRKKKFAVPSKRIKVELQWRERRREPAENFSSGTDDNYVIMNKRKVKNLLKWYFKA